MSKYVEFELGDRLYTVECVSYHPPEIATRDNPGCGGEVELDDVVSLTEDGREAQMTLGEFVTAFAAYSSVTEASARVMIDEYVVEDVGQQLEDEFDGSVETFMREEDI